MNFNFFEDFTYNNKENKFELVEYQDSVKNNIILWSLLFNASIDIDDFLKIFKLNSL